MKKPERDPASIPVCPNPELATSPYYSGAVEWPNITPRCCRHGVGTCKTCGWKDGKKIEAEILQIHPTVILCERKTKRRK